MKTQSSESLRAIILDLDDTLYPYPVCNDAAKQALSGFLFRTTGKERNDVERTFDRAREEVKRTYGATAESHSRLHYIEKLLEILYGHVDRNIVDSAHEEFWRAYLDTMELREGVREFLEAARGRGVKVAIVTNLTTDIQKRKLARLNIEEYVDVLVTSEDAGIEKPDSRPFEIALEKLGVRPDEAVSIGDDYDSDVTTPLRFGMRAIYLDVNGRDFPLSVSSAKNFSELTKMLFR